MVKVNNILIDNAGFINKGAELMLYASKEKLKEIIPDSDFVCRGNVPVNNTNSFFELTNQKRQNFVPVNFIPSIISKKFFRFVTSSHITHVFDAGGFRFGDQWAERYSDDFINSWIDFYEKIYKKGGTIVFLPQAFGPFNEESARLFIKGISPFIRLLIARDEKSFENLRTVLGDDKRIRLFPDFTNIYVPKLNNNEKAIFNKFHGKICVIPNSKMLTHTEKKVADEYIPFLVNLTKKLKDIGEHVFFLNHEGKQDEDMIKEIIKNSNDSFDYVSGLNADQVKWLIGKSKLVITSRFHGLVSAFSQSVPAFCTSWSHKYQELLDDYKQSDCLLDVVRKSQSIEKIISFLGSIEWLTSTSSKLELLANTQKARSIEMWSEVEKLFKR